MTFPSAAGLTRLQACLLAGLVWAAIYLPALGSLEIKGEEGRRILPAVAMLDTGRWIVPQVGGVPYLSKPPLLNWLVAAAFRVAGNRSEWAARAPSALAVLGLALTMVGTLAGWLSPAGALLAAIFALTNIGLMEKGRLAEIEALYLSLFGVALCLWLGAWQRETASGVKPSWRAWTLPWIFLGLGLLTKGPLHLLFFYGIVVAVTVCAGRARDLWNPAHLGGVLLMLGIFAGWAVPYLRQTAASGAGGVWLAQFQGRLEVNEAFHLGNWLLNIPRGLVNFLPWVVLLPLAWRRTPGATLDTLDASILRGLRWGIGVGFLAVSLAPGGQPRYTLPLLVPASLLLALVLGERELIGSAVKRKFEVRRDLESEVDSDLRAPLAEERDPHGARRLPSTSEADFGAPLKMKSSFTETSPVWLPVVWRRVVTICLGLAMAGAVAAGYVGGPALLVRLGVVLGVLLAGGATLRGLRASGDPTTLAVASAIGMALLTVDYALGAIRPLRRAESVRPVGRAINRAVGVGGPVAVLRPGFLPFLFYVRELRYVQSVEELPPTVPYLLVRENELAGATGALRSRQIDTRIALRARDKRVKDGRLNGWVLLRLNPTPGGGL